MFSAAVADGRLDEWRAFQSELATTRRLEWAVSQRRRGITREIVWLDEDQSVVVIVIEAADPQGAHHLLEQSSDPFDEWYRARVRDLLPGGWSMLAPVFDSRPRPGTWRGLPQ